MADVWNPDDTITEVELVRQAKIGAVSEMTIEQTHAGYRVIVGLRWHPGRVALRTRRAETAPRMFKSLERLVEFIRNRCPTVQELGLVLLPAHVKKKKRKSGTKKRSIA